ncbi:permease prefix domain 1-containing protein [Spongiactinospora sp. TRM90649]|uniref:permease prefix domain 1-containing protein n=1 Tax=Spongiactinospora sp. TRM90649 TaxID=3031114 RepID=UPI0023F637DB|nr:permease prefix domain 1-containing protein [Spongiactinospora sp. TRM90649]MDF5753850.1 permease prefix domain 1-containing protein [Spongiactinospora sp. TRM90649]
MARGTVIEDYVTSLGRRLAGPHRSKRDLVTEARDSLIDAADALERDGLSRREAELAAVEEFGTVKEIAPEYQRELATGAGRRLGLVLFLTVPISAVMWSVIWKIFPTDPVDLANRPEWFVPTARAVDILQLLSGVAGALAMVLLGRGVRRFHRPERITGALGVFVWAMLPVMLVLCSALMFGSNGPHGFADYPPGVGLSWVSAIFMTMQLYTACRCLQTARRTARA